MRGRAFLATTTRATHIFRSLRCGNKAFIYISCIQVFLAVSIMQAESASEYCSKYRSKYGLNIKKLVKIGWSQFLKWN